MLHYGPLEGSKDKKAEVLTYIHDLPDYTWQEPDPYDPFSLVDQVRIWRVRLNLQYVNDVNPGGALTGLWVLRLLEQRKADPIRSSQPQP